MAFRACSNYYDNTDIRLVINCWITNTKPLNVTTLQNIFKDRFEAVDFRNCSASLLTRINNMSLDAGDNYMHNPSALCLISELMEIFLSTVFSLKIKEFQISEPYRSLPSNRQSGHLKWMCKNCKHITHLLMLSDLHTYKIFMFKHLSIKYNKMNI